MARLVPAGVTLRRQIDDLYPERDRRSDGWIGDRAHQSRESDHNVDPDGFVHAVDVDENLTPPGGGKAMREIADQLVELAREGKDGGRLKYIVYEDRIASGTYRDRFWVWRGSGYGHTIHLHVSFTARAERDGSPFLIPALRRGLWDGITPTIEAVRNAQALGYANPAAWRVACRLADLGHYAGDVLPRGDQAYPVRAITAFQTAHRIPATGNYTPRTHSALFEAA